MQKYIDGAEHNAVYINLERKYFTRKYLLYIVNFCAFIP